MAATTTTPLNITFGIELEFVCAYPPGCFDDDYGLLSAACLSGDDCDCDREHRAHVSAREALYHDLKRFDVPAVGYETDAMIAESEAQKDPYARWRVDEDGSIELEEAELEVLPRGFRTEAIELASRKFDLRTDDWRGEIRKVTMALAVLQQLGCRFFTNPSTGFHVHVGCTAADGGKMKIPLRVAKNVLQLTTAFERCIDGVHAVNRIEDPMDSVNHHYHTPLSWFHRNNGMSAPEGTSVYDWLATVEEAQTYEELGQIFTLSPECVASMGPTFYTKQTYGHNSAVNFDNLCEAADGHGRCEEDLTGTIEFRQHAGTTDLLEILSWVCLTTTMVGYCASASTTDFLALIAHGIDRDFDSRDFFSAIGCQADVKAVLTRDDEDEDAIIGFLGLNNYYAPLKYEKLDALVAVNDQEESELRDPMEVALTSWDKKYGFHFTVNAIQIPVEAIERYYADAGSEVMTLAHFFGGGQEKLESVARFMVLQRLAAIYQGGEASLLKEAEAEETGPVVHISRVPYLVEGLEHLVVEDLDMF